MRGLIIRSPFVEWILDGKKTWEIRGSATRIREKIALIRAGSGLVVGTCELKDVAGPLTLRQLKKNARKLNRWRSEVSGKPYPKTYAWVLSNPRKLRRPIAYRHRRGAIVWVKLRNDSRLAG